MAVMEIRDQVPIDDLRPRQLAYSPIDACRQLGIGRTTLYEEISAGRLKALKIGARTLIPGASMQAWLDNLPAKAS